MFLTKYEELKSKFSKEELTTLLCDKKYNYTELEKIYGFNKRLFSKLAKEYNIPKQWDAITKNTSNNRKINFDLNHVIHLYCDLNKSLREIAKIYNCQHNAVGEFLRKYNIEIRSGYSDIYYESRRKRDRKYKNMDSSGYLIISVNGEYIREHRYVMEKYLGRKLKENEYVHHIDFDKTNNDINNLFLFETNSLHKLYHGYIRTHPYIDPSEYLDYYKQTLKNTYDNPKWLYYQYIVKEKSCNAIAKELDISRISITNKLKETGIFYLRKPTVNQFM